MDYAETEQSYQDIQDLNKSVFDFLTSSSAIIEISKDNQHVRAPKDVYVFQAVNSNHRGNCCIAF